MKWLLDTNVVSEGIRLRPNRKVVSWVEQHPLDDLAISIVTMAELQDGAASSGPEDRLAQWLEDTVLPSFAERTLPLTLPVLIEWIWLSRRLAAERMTRKASDLLIAATARHHGLTVVTRNLRDFVPTGVAVYNPWTDEMQRMETP